MTDDPRKFLYTIFDSKPDSDYVYLFNLPSKKTQYVRNLESDRLELPTDENCYFGVGTVKTPLSTGRAGNKDVSGIPGFWVDIDIKTDQKKQNVPASLEAAHTWLNHVRYKPSVVVNSGHGLHAYWLLKEFFSINSKYDYSKITSLTKQFQDYIRSLQPYHLDATHELARIMRIPGTYNVKDKDHPVLCTIEYIGAERYLLDDIIDLVESVEIPTSTQSPLINVSLNLDKSATPPKKLFHVINNDSTFKQTWEHRRSADEIKDQTPSGYDLAIAIALVKYNWSDQDICDTMIYHRVEQKADLKLDRRDNYYSRTIAKARALVKTETRSDSVTAIIEAGTDDPEIIREQIKSSLDISIQSVERYGNKDNPIFVLLLKSGQKVEIGSIDDLYSQSKFGLKLFKITDQFPAKVKGKEWIAVLSMLTRLYKDYFDEDTTDKNILIQHIKVYTDRLHENTPINIHNRHCFMQDGKRYFNFDRFKSWLDKREGFTVPRVSMLLAQIGCQKERLNYTLMNEQGIEIRHQARFWSIEESELFNEEND